MEGFEEILPELTFTSNPLGHLELGVEVVVGASHLPDTDPVLSLEGELQGAPAKAGGQIHDEAHHVRQGNGINIPERVQKTRHQQDYVLVLSLQSHSHFYKQKPPPELHNLSVPALIPPNRLVAFGLKCCHNYVHIIVPIPQHALLVGSHHSVGRQPANRRGDCSNRCLLNLYSTAGKGLLAVELEAHFQGFCV